MTDWDQVQLQVRERLYSWLNSYSQVILCHFLLSITHWLYWQMTIQVTTVFTYTLNELFFRQYRDVWLTVQFVSCHLLTKVYTRKTPHHGPLFCCPVHTCFTPPVSRHSKNSPWTNDECVLSVGLFTRRRCCSESHWKEYDALKSLYKYRFYHFGGFCRQLISTTQEIIAKSPKRDSLI